MKDLILTAIIAGQIGLGAQANFLERTKQPAPEPQTAVVNRSVIRPSELLPPTTMVALLPTQQAIKTATDTRAVMVVDDKDRVLFSKNAYQPRPLASITKLMTALVFLDHNPGWDKVITLQASDSAEPARLDAVAGEQLRVKDLFYAMLVGSKNNAAKALARSTGLRQEEFVALMNKKARDLGMSRARFVDVTGLDKENVGSAQDCVLLAQAAFKNKDIARATNTKEYVVKMVKAIKNKKHTVKTTNDLLGNGLVQNGKTGYIEESGYNVIVRGTKESHEMIAVIFGAKSEKARFDIAQALLTQGFGGKLTIAAVR